MQTHTEWYKQGVNSIKNITLVVFTRVVYAGKVQLVNTPIQ